MRYNSFRTPGAGPADDPLFETGLVLKPPPYEPERDFGSEGEPGQELRLDREPPERPARRVRGPSRRALVLSGWAAVLAVAVSLAYVFQPGRGLTTPADEPPAVASPEDLGAPATAPSIASQPERFAQAASAPEINAPASVDDAQGPGGLQTAQAEPTAPPEAAEPPSAPADPPAPARATFVGEPVPTDAPKAVKAAAEKDAGPAAKVERPADKPKAAKLAERQKLADGDEAKPAKAERPKTADKPKLADAKDLPELKARLNHAYAQAVKAGTPKSVLKARQAEWLVLRAKAEKKGPAAVAALYRTRAAQLEAIAKKTAAHTSVAKPKVQAAA